MFEGIELFKSLSQQDLKTLEIFCQERSYQSGEIIFTQGDEATAMYIVKSGVLQAYNYDKILGEIYPGNIFGEMAIFSPHKTRMASVKAIENSIVITLLAFSINELGIRHPEILGKIKDIIELRSKQNEGK